MSIATGSNTATPTPAAAHPASGDDPEQVSASSPGTVSSAAVERALAAAVQDANLIGDLLDVLRTARLWLPLPDDGSPVIRGTAVTLPTVSYLGSEFVPAYSSPELLAKLADPSLPGATVDLEPSGLNETADAPPPPSPTDAGIAILPHVVVRAADLARLLPPDIGIALNAGASESVPVYPQGVSYLAAGTDDARGRVQVGPLPMRPDALLASIAAELMQIPAVAGASAAWLSVQFAGEGLLVAVTLDSPNDPEARDAVIAAVERAAWQAAAQDAGFPIDVTFPGEGEPDDIDQQLAEVGTAFYRR